jgi:hypothetical protein
MLEFMARAGLTATGEVRSETPEEAVQNVARGPEGPFDKVVAIWRERKYRWLYGGVREQLEAQLGIPVESIHAEPPVAHSKLETLIVSEPCSRTTPRGWAGRSPDSPLVIAGLGEEAR